MRLALILVVLNLAPLFAQSTVEKARVEGQIIALTGEPVRKASVRLQGNSTAQVNTSGPSMPTAYTAQSDAAGNFVFEDVEPGRYTLSADRAGYVRGIYGPRANAATPLVLSAGQKMTGLSIKLTPEGTISGKITDEDGDPVARAQVMIYQSRYQNGRRTLMMSGSAANTANDGTFQIGGLSAGRYYLTAADLQGFVVNGPSDVPGTKGPEMSYVTTYYPNGSDPSSAVGIDVTSGNDVRGIEIRLQKARIFRVHGRVDTSAAVANTSLQLVPQDSPDAWLFTSPRTMVQVKPDGTFAFEHVLSGTYLIRSQVFRSNNESGTGPATLLFSRQLVTISNANVNNLEVRLIPAGEISGKIATEGKEQTASAATPSVRPVVGLAPLQAGFGGNLGIQSSADSTFLLKNVPPDIYRVTVNSLPSGTYVKSIRFGGADVTKSALDTTSGASGQIEVLLSPEAADLSGVVHNAQGDAVAGVDVNLWEPDAPNILPDALLNRNATTDQNGHFQLRNLPPGEYRLAAWEQINPNIQDPQFRAKFDAQAATVKLTASAHANNDAPLISQEAIEMEAAKLR